MRAAGARRLAGLAGLTTCGRQRATHCAAAARATRCAQCAAAARAAALLTTTNRTEWTAEYCFRELTHVAWCHLEVDAAGNLTAAWSPADWRSVPALVAHVHAVSPWTRVLLTVAISGHATEPGENKTLFLRDRARWPRFLDDLADRIREAGADGVMFDIEHIDRIPGGLAAFAALVLRTATYLRQLPPRPAGRPALQTMLCTAQYTTEVVGAQYTTDNATSLARKYERAKSAGLQGVGIWGTWYGTLPLGAQAWQALAQSF